MASFHSADLIVRFQKNQIQKKIKNFRMDPTVRVILSSGKVGELRKYLLSLKSEDELKRTLYPKEKETSMLHEAIALRDDATTCSLLLSFGSGGVNSREMGMGILHCICVQSMDDIDVQLCSCCLVREDIKSERGLDPEKRG